GSGIEFIKFFPAGSVEPESLKMICGPFRKLSIIVTGGITTDENILRKWFFNGANAFGIGSSLITKDDILTDDYEGIRVKSDKLIKILKTLEK
ncbi:MAG: bifunctional 4-hydroxy-2-oxoglutarate aldolase/2-dehydro-3-deoxy-phosphogluconate aldolase, partial [Actinomycetia bacterium]|nr:bifunctional 4-hydroxy-2-oxoglutarate aldolase/2-dehydro-3-deoxy-phosphogluconate aldolase [Actinomycetes bacterium]